MRGLAAKAETMPAGAAGCFIGLPWPMLERQSRGVEHSSGLKSLACFCYKVDGVGGCLLNKLTTGACVLAAAAICRCSVCWPMMKLATSGGIWV